MRIGRSRSEKLATTPNGRASSNERETSQLWSALSAPAFVSAFFAYGRGNQAESETVAAIYYAAALVIFASIWVGGMVAAEIRTRIDK